MSKTHTQLLVRRLVSPALVVALIPCFSLGGCKRSDTVTPDEATSDRESALAAYESEPTLTSEAPLEEPEVPDADEEEMGDVSDDGDEEYAEEDDDEFEDDEMLEDDE